MPADRHHRVLAERLRILAALALVAVCVWWVLAPPVPEGPVLIRVTENHGLDLSDLATIPVLVGALWIVRPRARDRTRR